MLDQLFVFAKNHISKICPKTIPCSGKINKMQGNTFYKEQHLETHKSLAFKQDKFVHLLGHKAIAPILAQRWQ